VPSLVARGVSFLLAPLYTRAMVPADFGVVGISNAVLAAVSVILGFAIHGAVPRMWVECETDAQRRRFVGALLGFMLVVPTVLTIVLDFVGSMGWFDGAFATVQFRPHLRLVLWTAFLGTFPNVPTAIYMAREKPGNVALFNVVLTTASIAMALLFVAGLKQGALGVLRAQLFAAATTAALSVVVLWRMSPPTLDRARLVQALAFSLPLVPHLLANWALAISDRIVLERLVSKDDLGRYSLAYMFCTLASVIGAAVSSAFGPITNRRLKASPDDPTVPRLGTYAIVAIIGASLAIALFAPELIIVVAPVSYRAAAALVPLLVLGAVFQGLYVVFSTGTWYSMKTARVPLVTAIGAAVNLGLNVVLVPRFGVLAAALDTAIAYATLAGLHAWLAHRLHPIAWEWRRITVAFGVGVACFFAGALLPQLPLGWALCAKLALLACGFPLALVALGFVRAGEWSAVRSLLRRA
jgi:O-antigen/teichoic acid export membrane protein